MARTAAANPRQHGAGCARGSIHSTAGAWLYRLVGRGRTHRRSGAADRIDAQHKISLGTTTGAPCRRGCQRDDGGRPRRNRRRRRRIRGRAGVSGSRHAARRRIARRALRRYRDVAEHALPANHGFRKRHRQNPPPRVDADHAPRRTGILVLLRHDRFSPLQARSRSEFTRLRSTARPRRWRCCGPV